MISEKADILINIFENMAESCGHYNSSPQDVQDREQSRDALVNHISSLEAENAALKERLAAYEVGFDPAERMPDDSDDVFVKANDGRSYYAVYDCPSDDSIARFIVLPFGNSTPVFSINDITRWFPLPGKGGEA